MRRKDEDISYPRNRSLVFINYLMLFILTLSYVGFILLVLTVLPETNNVVVQYKLKEVWVPGEFLSLRNFLQYNWYFIPIPIAAIMLINLFLKNKSFSILMNSLFCLLIFTVNVSLVIMLLYKPLFELVR